MVPRRALQESNVAVEDPPRAVDYTELRVSTSPLPNAKGKAPPIRPPMKTPADYPQLFTPGGCPVDSESCYEDFGTKYISGPKDQTKPQPKQAALRQRGSSVDGAPAEQNASGRSRPRVLSGHSRLAAMDEEEGSIACLEPSHCSIS